MTSLLKALRNILSLVPDLVVDGIGDRDLRPVGGSAVTGFNTRRKFHHPATVGPLADLSVVLRHDLAADLLVAASGKGAMFVT